MLPEVSIINNTLAFTVFASSMADAPYISVSSAKQAPENKDKAVNKVKFFISDAL